MCHSFEVRHNVCAHIGIYRIECALKACRFLSYFIDCEQPVQSTSQNNLCQGCGRRWRSRCVTEVEAIQLYSNYRRLYSYYGPLFPHVSSSSSGLELIQDRNDVDEFGLRMQRFHNRQDSLGGRYVIMVRLELQKLIGLAGYYGKSADTLATNDGDGDDDKEEEEEMTGVLGELLIYHSRNRNLGDNLPHTWRGICCYLRQLCHNRSPTG